MYVIITITIYLAAGSDIIFFLTRTVLSNFKFEGQLKVPVNFDDDFIVQQTI